MVIGNASADLPHDEATDTFSIDFTLGGRHIFIGGAPRGQPVRGVTYVPWVVLGVVVVVAIFLFK